MSLQRLTTIFGAPKSDETMTQITSDYLYVGNSTEILRASLIREQSGESFLEDFTHKLAIRPNDIINTFEIDEGSRLIAILAEDTETGYRCLYLRDSVTGGSHINVSPSCHRIGLGVIQNASVEQVAIFGDQIGVLLAGELTVYDWRTGQQTLKSRIPRHQRCKSFTFLSADIIVTTYFGFLGIDVWYPRQSLDEGSPGPWQRWITLLFPTLSEHYDGDVAGSITCSSMSTSGVHAKAIVTFSLYMDSPETTIPPPGYIFKWVFLQEALVQTVRLIASYQPIHHLDGTAFPVPWNIWGPQISRCFNVTKAKMEVIDYGNTFLSILDEDEDDDEPEDVNRNLRILRPDVSVSSLPPKQFKASEQELYHNSGIDYEVVFSTPVLSALECTLVFDGTIPYNYVMIDDYRRIIARRRIQRSEEECESERGDYDMGEDEEEGRLYIYNVFTF